MNAGTLEIQLLVEMSRIVGDMKKVEGVIGGTMAKVERAAAGAMRALGAIGGAISLTALAAMVKNVNDATDALNDLSDATGASVENLSALRDIARRTGASFDTVGQALVKFNQSLSTAKAGSDAEKVYRAIGLSITDLKQLDPAEAMQKTAMALAQFADDGNKARAVQELFGKSLREVAPLLKDMAEAGRLNATVTRQQAEEAERFNKHLFGMRTEVENLKTEIVTGLVPAMNRLLRNYREIREMGAMDLVLKDAARGLVGNQRMTGDHGADINRTIAERTKLERDLARAVADQNKTHQKSIAEDIAGLNRYLQLLRMKQVNQIMDASTESDLHDAISRRMNTQKQSLGDILRDTPKVAKLVREMTEEEKDREHFMKFRRDLQVRQTEEYLRAIEAINRAIREGEAAYAKYTSSLLDGVASLDEQIRAEKEATERLGLSKRAIVELDAAKLQLLATGTELELQRAREENASEREIELLKIRIKQYRDLADAKLARSDAESAKEAGDEIVRQAAQARDEWERTNQQIADSFVDNLMRGGKSVAEYLKDLFRTLVLRPILAPVGSAMAGVMGSLPTAAAAGGFTGGSGLLGSIGSSAMGSAIMGGIGGFSSAFGYGASALFGGTGMTALAGGASMVGAGAIAQGLGMIAGVLGPIAAAAAIIAAFVKDGGGPKADGRSGWTVSDIGRAGTVGTLNSAAGQAVAGLQAQFDGLMKLLGTSSNVKFGVGISTDPSGDSATFADFTASRDGQAIWHVLRRDIGRSEQELQAAMTAMGAQALVGALQSVMHELPPVVRRELQGIDTTALSAEAAGGIVATIQKALAEKGALEDRLFALTATDAEQLARAREKEREAIDATNHGLLDSIYAREDQLRAEAEAAQAAADAQRQAEEAAAAARAIASERAGLERELLELQGDTLALRQIERNAVDESNRALYDQIMALRDQQEAARQAEEAATRAAQEAARETERIAAEAIAKAKAVADERAAIERELMTLQGNVAGLRQLELAALDPANQALKERIFALQDEAAAIERNNALMSQLANVAPFFMSDDQVKQWKAQEFATQFGAKTGIQFSADQVLQFARDKGAQGFADYFSSIKDTNPAIRDALIELAPLFQSLVPSVQQALDDQKKAADEERQTRAAALQDQIQAAQELARIWRQLSDSLMDEVRRTRGLLVPNSREGLAQLQAQFAIASAQARAGNADAGGLLVGLNQSILSMAQEQLSGIDLSRLIAQQAFSLEQTGLRAGAIADKQESQAESLKRIAQRLDSLEGVMRESVNQQAKLASNSDITVTHAREQTSVLKEGRDVGFKVLPGSRPLPVTVS